MQGNSSPVTTERSLRQKNFTQRVLIGEIECTAPIRILSQQKVSFSTRKFCRAMGLTTARVLSANVQQCITCDTTTTITKGPRPVKIAVMWNRTGGNKQQKNTRVKSSTTTSDVQTKCRPTRFRQSQCTRRCFECFECSDSFGQLHFGFGHANLPTQLPILNRREIQLLLLNTTANVMNQNDYSSDPERVE